MKPSERIEQIRQELLKKFGDPKDRSEYLFQYLQATHDYLDEEHEKKLLSVNEEIK